MLKKYFPKNIKAVSPFHWQCEAQRHAEKVFYKAWYKNNGHILMDEALDEKEASWLASLPSEPSHEDYSWAMVRRKP